MERSALSDSNSSKLLRHRSEFTSAVDLHLITAAVLDFVIITERAFSVNSHFVTVCVPYRLEISVLSFSLCCMRLFTDRWWGKEDHFFGEERMPELNKAENEQSSSGLWHILLILKNRVPISENYWIVLYAKLFCCRLIFALTGIDENNCDCIMPFYLSKWKQKPYFWSTYKKYKYPL